MLFMVDQLLSPDLVTRVRGFLDQGTFLDGLITAESAKSKKNNRELKANESYMLIAELINNAVEASDTINNRLLPRYRTNPIINRYEVGMFYKSHIDAPIQGGTTQVGRSSGRYGQNFLRTDYSMTLFLSDPNSYDGGELEVHLADEVRLLKLPAGSAVCYSTGLHHAIRPVTRGCRLAAIYWFQSLVRDVHLRRVIWEQYELRQALAADGKTAFAEQAAAIRDNLIRYLADV